MKQNLCIKVKYYPFPYSNSLKDEMLIGSMCPHAAALFPSILYLKEVHVIKKQLISLELLWESHRTSLEKQKKIKNDCVDLTLLLHE